jgi:hypothetical protein
MRGDLTTLLSSRRLLLTRAATAAVCVGVIWFYVAAATEHGRQINVSKARGDQSGYLGDAQRVYGIWTGTGPKLPVGDRNRMPLYAGYLAFFYHQGLSDPDFFDVGKRANIWLSLALLAIIGVVVWRELPPIAALNLVGVAAFGTFIFKAGYTQSELLFYALFFFAFLVCWHLLRSPAGPQSLALGALAGGLAGLAYLTKAAVMPFVLLVVAALVLQPGALADTHRSTRPGARHTAWRASACLALGVAFLAVLSPYLATNKRLYDRYFFNVNSTFYVWYDDWPKASVHIRDLGDGQRWPDIPDRDLPGPGRYWREHSIGHIARRVASGFQDMAVVSYRTYNFLWYLIVYGGAVAVLAGVERRRMGAMLRDHAWLSLFLVAYAALYLFATAFYYPISGTGTARFLMAHLLPLFFVLSRVLSSERFSACVWTPFGLTVTPARVQAGIMVMLAIDVCTHVWPRLMSTYGGF